MKKRALSHTLYILKQRYHNKPGIKNNNFLRRALLCISRKQQPSPVRFALAFIHQAQNVWLSSTQVFKINFNFEEEKTPFFWNFKNWVFFCTVKNCFFTISNKLKRAVEDNKTTFFFLTQESFFTAKQALPNILQQICFLVMFGVQFSSLLLLNSAQFLNHFHL